MVHRLNVRLVIVALTLCVALSQAASAQFGMLKRLKNSISPDSAAKVEQVKQDSIALAAKRAVGDTTPLERSKFARAVTAAGNASDKFEQVTGVSAKDAALAASGVGAAGLVAKKMGVDPVSLGTKALQQRAQAKAAGVGSTIPGMPAMPGIPGMPNVADLMKMQQTAAVQVNSATKPLAGHSPATGGVAGFTDADARALAAFQTEMMEVATAASAGDLVAQARLERWQMTILKYQPEIEKLSVSAGAGDMAAVQRLQAIQLDIVKEWVGTAAVKAKVTKPAVKAAAKAKP
jgi:hypothetical protein